MLTDWLSRICKKVQRWRLYVSKYRHKSEGYITLRIKIHDLPKTVLLTVVESFAKDLLFGTVSIDEHSLAILSDKQKVSSRESSTVAIVKQHDVFSIAFFTKYNTQCANLKTHLEATDDHRSTIETLEQSFSHQKKVARAPL